MTVGTTTVNALMYYASDSQVAALLPSNTPTTGPGTFTVTYNGQTSNGVQHGTTNSNAGIFTIDSTQGPGIFTCADYSLASAVKATPCGGPNTACGSANPGDTLILWATGLGPVNGDDASGAGLGVNMPNLPLTLWVGGVKATVLYQGRSGYIGEDQINFTVPDGTPLGCAVPVVIQIGTNANTVSNTVALPIAKGSRNCTPANAALAQLDFSQAAAAGQISIGNIKLQHFSDGTENLKTMAARSSSRSTPSAPAHCPSRLPGSTNLQRERASCSIISMRIKTSHLLLRRSMPGLQSR